MFSSRVAARISVRWVTTPTARRSASTSVALTSCPATNTVPGGGSTARDSIAASVDFPAPVRPTSAHVVPAGTCRLSERTAKPPP